jgi:dTDP-4-amino-4,6-dideoxygalactose transaminase
MRIPLIRPYITDELKQRVCDVLDSGYLTEGSTTSSFEQAVASYVGVAHCIAVTSCTVGLELALRVVGVGPDDDVIVPDYTYPATAYAVSLVGAVPVIVDVNPETMLIDYDALSDAITDKTKAVVPVSLFGNPLDWDRLDAIKAEYGVYMIEDAACALGSSFKGAMTGTQADIAVFSHHPRKFITTGEGGTIVTHNDAWADWMRSYKHFGAGESNSSVTMRFDRVGTNYKLSNVLAAIGLTQMVHVDELLARRQALAATYSNALNDMRGVMLPQTTEHATHSYQSFCVFVEDRDRIMHQLRQEGVEAQIGTYALHMHKAFENPDKTRFVGKMQHSRRVFERALSLPLFHEMTAQEQELVTQALVNSITSTL